MKHYDFLLQRETEIKRWTDKQTETETEIERGDLGVGKMAVKFPMKWERNVLEKTGFDL